MTYSQIFPKYSTIFNLPFVVIVFFWDLRVYIWDWEWDQQTWEKEPTFFYCTAFMILCINDIQSLPLGFPS